MFLVMDSQISDLSSEMNGNNNYFYWFMSRSTKVEMTGTSVENIFDFIPYALMSNLLTQWFFSSFSWNPGINNSYLYTGCFSIFVSSALLNLIR